MNKKFSTLLVGAMLAAVGVGSVSAQTTKLDKVDGTYNQKLYQITVGANSDSVIVMTKRADGSDSLYVKNRTTLGADSLANSLWCVAMTKPAQAGQHPIYDFRNKATGKKLAIDINSAWNKNQVSADTLAVGVDLDGWAFSEAFPVLADKRPLYTYIPGQDSVVALAWNQAGARGGLEAMKVAAVADSIKKHVTDAGYVFTLRTPDHLTLNAHALHTLFGRNSDGTSVQFHFWKGNTELKNTPTKEMVKGNVFGQELIAKDTVTARGTAGIIFKTKKEGKYLRVDTAWHNQDGVRFNVLSDTTTQNAFDLDNAAGSIGQYIFQVNYAPAGDSIYMRVDTAIYNNTFVEKDNFHRWTGDADSTYVVLQNLTANQQWALTVGKDSVATRIGLGIGTCGDEVGLGRVSVKDGLYTIKDKTSGKYFAYPLYGNGDVQDWVEFDEGSQLAAHMPAYQWIIDRTYDSGDLAETSPITIENREYKNKFTVQLYKDKDGKIFARSSDLAGANLEIVEISKEDYPEAYTDKYLGYYHRPAADIQYNVNKYVFRYFHPYALDDDARYLTIDNDSLLYAKENRRGVNFELQSYESKEYSYGVAHNIAGGDITKEAYKKSIYGIIGIVPLKRTAYIIAREGAVLDSIADKKYAMAQREYLTDVDSFYMKANNYYGEDDYFTIIKSYQTGSDLVPAFSKAGISDNNLNSPMGVQELSTERSSAFSIKYDDTPLYRRFNNANIGEEEIGRDSLKFREFYRDEYLMDETNTNFLDENVDYLGIWTADKAKGKLAFRVDTAWVTRGLGYIKPQYLISVSNSFYEGKVAEDCHEDGVHIDRETLEVTDDASACIHAKMAVPSFWRGKYLVSFADSVAKYNGKDEALPYLDKIGAYTRVGFVDAIQKGDSLYVLPAAYRNVKNEDIDFVELDELNAELKDEFDRGASDEYPFIINLKGDDHKNVTWSFRYVYPDEALSVEAESKENSFLIESMAYTEKDGKYDSAGSKLSIAPNCAAWLKNQNGCLVLTNERSSFVEAVTGGDPALIFNVDRRSADDDYATDNEEIATSEVTVIAQEGAVRVANAEGKKVVITNVLGQVVANTVITSSDVVIAAPAGVVVVAIEGEEAVKAVVK